MRTYCKAYHLGDLRQFSEWQEQPNTAGPTLSDESVVYLWNDFTVATSPIHSHHRIFDHVTPQWQAFCMETLHFIIPADLRYAATDAGTA